MRIAIIPGVEPSDGGIYQYSLTVLEALREIKADFTDDEFVSLAMDPDSPLMNQLREQGWFVLPLVPPTGRRRIVKFVEQMVGAAPKRQLLKMMNKLGSTNQSPTNFDLIQEKPELKQWFESNRIELIIYPISTTLSFETGIPYIMAVHDLQHRLQPEFPEVSANGEWEKREYLFRNAIRNATLILADSLTGKEDILKYYGQYGVSENRIKVLPFIQSSKLNAVIDENEMRRVQQSYSLPPRYVFYPAQFWPHKNHRRIIEALDLLRTRYSLEIPLVLSGSHSGAIRQQTFSEMQDLAGRLNIARQISYLGYVPDDDMPFLYAGATALVMPTFFGPTNIPALEAWKLNCPVLTSDIRGIREQVGDAAVLVDPTSTESIAEGIRRLWEDAGLRDRLREMARQRLLTLSPEIFRERLTDILVEAKSLVQKTPKDAPARPQMEEEWNTSR